MKDPAFLFYPGDWLGGTQWFSLEQKGCYLELLILQFNTGKFTEEQAKQVLSICFDNAWHVVKQKFTFDGEYYFNERLKIEIDRRQKFTESRRINGLKPKEKKEDSEAYAKHMETENENEILIDYKNWKLDFKVYFKYLMTEFEKLKNDGDWILMMRKTNPTLDILKSLDRSVSEFWGTEKGWENKKAGKSKMINWKVTFAKTINYNAVLKIAQKLAM